MNRYTYIISLFKLYFCYKTFIIELVSQVVRFSYDTFMLLYIKRYLYAWIIVNRYKNCYSIHSTADAPVQSYIVPIQISIR